MTFGFGLGLGGRAAGAAVFNPATLTLTGWWRASFGGAPWVGTTSAGGSGSENLTDLYGNPPSVGGTAQNGYDPASFDGSNDALAAGTASALVSASAGSIAVLMKPTLLIQPAAGTYPFQDPNILADNGGTLAVGFSDAGWRVGIYDTAWTDVSVAQSTGSYFFGQMKWDGSTLKARVNGGSWSSTAAGAIDGGAGVTGVMRVGFSVSGAYIQADVLEIFTANTTLSDANFDSLLSYCRSRYALSLT